MMLNNLYGTFGRSLQGLKPIIIGENDVAPFLFMMNNKSLTRINDNYSMILSNESANTENLAELSSILVSTQPEGIKTKQFPPKANVAIAAAITSYARIHMMDLKLNHDVLYSDTDSVFTTHPLPDHLIGPGLGQLKDEMAGILIDKAYFLGPKQYGYTYRNQEGIQVDKSV